MLSEFARIRLAPDSLANSDVEFLEGIMRWDARGGGISVNAKSVPVRIVIAV